MESSPLRTLVKHNIFESCIAPLVCMVVALLAGCTSPSHPGPEASERTPNRLSFTGLWVAPETDKTSFELDLSQHGQELEGYHAALVGDTGNIEAALRLDREPPSVRGRVGDDGRAQVRFELRKSSGFGEAVLTLSGDKLRWRLLSSSGASVLPKS